MYYTNGDLLPSTQVRGSIIVIRYGTVTALDFVNTDSNATDYTYRFKLRTPLAGNKVIQGLKILHISL